MEAWGVARFDCSTTRRRVQFAVVSELPVTPNSRDLPIFPFDRVRFLSHVTGSQPVSPLAGNLLPIRPAVQHRTERSPVPITSPHRAASSRSPLDNYLHEIDRTPLLSAAEEKM